MRTVQVVATASAVALTIGVLAVLGVTFANAHPAPVSSPAPVVAVDPAPVVTAPATPAPTVAPTVTPAAPVAPAPAPANNWAPGQAPAGTPIQPHTDRDPNSGTYGQTINGPEGFCASNGGTTLNGVSVCA